MIYFWTPRTSLNLSNLKKFTWKLTCCKLEICWQEFLQSKRTWTYCDKNIDTLTNIWLKKVQRPQSGSTALNCVAAGKFEIYIMEFNVQRSNILLYMWKPMQPKVMYYLFLCLLFKVNFNFMCAVLKTPRNNEFHTKMMDIFFGNL